MSLLIVGVRLVRVNIEEKDHLLVTEIPTEAVLHQVRNIQFASSFPSMQGHPLLSLLFPGQNGYEELKLEKCLRQNRKGSMVGGSVGIYRKVVLMDMLEERRIFLEGMILMVNLQDQALVVLHQIESAGVDIDTRLNMLVIQEIGRK